MSEKLHIERNISSYSSYDLPFCVVNEDGVVIKRCGSNVEAIDFIHEAKLKE